MDNTAAMDSSSSSAARAMFMVRLAAPPIPLLCRNSASREEQWCSSHSLISAIAGRLAVSLHPDNTWQERVLTGAHLQELLESDLDYDSFCIYTRAVLVNMMSLDAGEEYARRNSDIRFLHDLGRVNWAKNSLLCMDAVEYYCMQLALLTDSTSEQVGVVRQSYLGNKKPYEDVLQETISLLLSRRVRCV